jgi:hypothetical protein
MNRKLFVVMQVVLLALAGTAVGTAAGHPVVSPKPTSNSSAGGGRTATRIAPKEPFTIDLFGDGRDGDLVLFSGQTIVITSTRVPVTAAGDSAAPANSNGFNDGDEVLFHQTQGTAGVGNYEFDQIAHINTDSDWTLVTPLTNAYSSTNGRAQVIKVLQFRNVNLHAGSTLTAPAWDDSTGGILVFLANGSATINGAVTTSGGGYFGGVGGSRATHTGAEGDSYPGPGTYCSTNGCNSRQNNGGGGGSGGAFGSGSGGGAGGGFGSVGENAQTGNPMPGTTYGTAELGTIFIGSGGGGGYENGSNATGGSGGNGSGLVLIYARNFQVNGTIQTNGSPGQSVPTYGGGGGSGGTVKLLAESMSVGNSNITALGGAGGIGGNGSTGGNGGAGGIGRIRIEYCSTFSGSTNPPASVQQITTCPPVVTPTPTPTNTPTTTPTGSPTSTPTNTLTNTPTVTSTPPPIIVGHVRWQGRPNQPSVLQQLPITFTLKMGTIEVNYPVQNTDIYGFFTVTLGTLPNSGVYSTRVKGPKYLARSGLLSLSGAPVTEVEFDLMLAGDANNDNVVNTLDFNILRTAFGKSLGEPGYDDRADFNGDLVVNSGDFTLLRGNFGIAGGPLIRMSGR